MTPSCTSRTALHTWHRAKYGAGVSVMSAILTDYGMLCRPDAVHRQKPQVAGVRARKVSRGSRGPGARVAGFDVVSIWPVAPGHAITRRSICARAAARDRTARDSASLGRGAAPKCNCSCGGRRPPRPAGSPRNPDRSCRRPAEWRVWERARGHFTRWPSPGSCRARRRGSPRLGSPASGCTRAG